MRLSRQSDGESADHRSFIHAISLLLFAVFFLCGFPGKTNSSRSRERKAGRKRQKRRRKKNFLVVHYAVHEHLSASSSTAGCSRRGASTKENHVEMSSRPWEIIICPGQTEQHRKLLMEFLIRAQFPSLSLSANSSRQHISF